MNLRLGVGFCFLTLVLVSTGKEDELANLASPLCSSREQRTNGLGFDRRERIWVRGGNEECPRNGTARTTLSIPSARTHTQLGSSPDCCQHHRHHDRHHLDCTLHTPYICRTNEKITCAKRITTTYDERSRGRS